MARKSVPPPPINGDLPKRSSKQVRRGQPSNIIRFPVQAKPKDTLPAPSTFASDRDFMLWAASYMSGDTRHAKKLESERPRCDVIDFAAAKARRSTSALRDTSTGVILRLLEEAEDRGESPTYAQLLEQARNLGSTR